MAALWVQQQSRGRTKVVIVGRPRRMLDHFALVVATPQYRLPHRANVLNLDLPLMRIDAAKIAEAAETWRVRFEAMARPLTAVLVGGPTQPLVLDADVARRLVALIERSTHGKDGALFVTTSRRTPPAVVEGPRLVAGLAQRQRPQPPGPGSLEHEVVRIAPRSHDRAGGIHDDGVPDMDALGETATGVGGDNGGGGVRHRRMMARWRSCEQWYSDLTTRQ